MNEQITGCVIAGGKSLRMQGKNKGLQTLAGKRLCEYAIEMLEDHVESILINNNDLDADYSWCSYPIIADQMTGYLGPLAGVHAGLLACKTNWMLTVSVDTPFISSELVKRLVSHRLQNTSSCYYVIERGRAHPLFLLINRDQITNIERFLKQGFRKVMLFLQQINAIAVDFSDLSDQFININTLDELEYWNKKLITKKSVEARSVSD